MSFIIINREDGDDEILLSRELPEPPLIPSIPPPFNKAKLECKARASVNLPPTTQNNIVSSRSITPSNKTYDSGLGIASPGWKANILSTKPTIPAPQPPLRIGDELKEPLISDSAYRKLQYKIATLTTQAIEQIDDMIPFLEKQSVSIKSISDKLQMLDDSIVHLKKSRERLNELRRREEDIIIRNNNYIEEQLKKRLEVKQPMDENQAFLKLFDRTLSKAKQSNQYSYPSPLSR